jgi:hypothetical protein
MGRREDYSGELWAIYDVLGRSEEVPACKSECRRSREQERWGFGINRLCMGS